MPPWQRDSLPLLVCVDTLALVPGIGVNAAFQADRDARLPGSPAAREC